MTRISLAEVAHRVVAERLEFGDMAIDATLGNGHDALFLADRVGVDGMVYGFDIQAQAIASSRQRLQHHGMLDRVILFHGSHHQMMEFLPAASHGRIKVVMFNLGYLPGADKSVITETVTTLQAIETACRILMMGGVVTVMAYPGHLGGDLETQQLEAWCRRLDPISFEFELILSAHHKLTAPRLFVIRKLLDLL
jgi:ubiquinone/menaquinone biosynthesis C-methylase UbiE